MTKLLFIAYTLFLQSDLASINAQQVEELKKLQETDELSRLTTILSIALITILILLTISLVKNSKLQNEVNRLKNLDS